MKIFPTLYARGQTGAVLQWTIKTDGDSFFVEAGQVGGQLTTSKPNKCVGKNIGKKNETTPEQQAELEAAAKWDKKQRSEGYWQNVADIDTPRYFEPMLAKKFIDYQTKIKYPVFVEPKLNGICCIITKNRAHSRRGQDFFCIDHIREELAPIFEKYSELHLHGELFSWKYKNELNQISSLVSVNRKAKDVTPEDVRRSREIVQFFVYDGVGGPIDWNASYSLRKIHLGNLLRGLEFVKTVEGKLVHSENEVFELLSKSKENNEEGLMIKIPEGKYEQKRSSNILKLKNWQDEEFKILGFEEGSGNWSGCAKMVICELPNGESFRSNLRGTQEELAAVLNEQDKYVGQIVTVDYQEKSIYGVPLIPYTKIPDCIRNYE